MFTCPQCDYQNSKLNSMRIHAAKKHGMSSEDLYLKIVLNGQRPLCKCGCGSETRFRGLTVGYVDYVPGHQARVKNNWGHNPKAQANSLRKRREEGLWSKVPWNKGKTKENDPSYALIVEKAYLSRGERKRRSKNMKQQWKDGNLQILSGKNHSQWKGGTSRLSAICRSHIYKVWTYPKLKEAGFTCRNCQSTSDLTVHHDQKRFAEILQEAVAAIGDPGENFERKTEVAEWVADYHQNEQVSGVVLCVECHRKEHAADQSR